MIKFKGGNGSAATLALAGSTISGVEVVECVYFGVKVAIGFQKFGGGKAPTPPFLLLSKVVANSRIQKNRKQNFRNQKSTAYWGANTTNRNPMKLSQLSGVLPLR